MIGREMGESKELTVLTERAPPNVDYQARYGIYFPTHFRGK
jgi:hypothetical protein